MLTVARPENVKIDEDTPGIIRVKLEDKCIFPTSAVVFFRQQRD